jgi:hypothetical protein
MMANVRTILLLGEGGGNLSVLNPQFISTLDWRPGKGFLDELG